jgi:hypothetical protein
MARPSRYKKRKDLSSGLKYYPTQSVDIIISSGRIRTLFLQRCDELKVNPYKIAEMAGINANHFRDYYVHKEKPKVTTFLSQYKMIKALKIVGIDIRVLVAVTPIDKHKQFLAKKGITLQKAKRHDSLTKFDKKSQWC